MEAKYKGLKSDNKMVNQHNLRLKQRVRKLEKSNEHLKRFAIVAAHDLKAPLQTISSFSEILYNKYKLKFEEKDHRLFEFIIEGCSDLNHLIEELLNYSSISKKPYKAVPVDLKKVFDQIMKKLEIPIRESKAKIILPRELPIIRGQNHLMELLFLNLMNNAIKFRRKNVPLKIEVSHEYCSSNGYVKIGISDNGIGIDPNNHQEVFKVFKKLHPAHHYEGNGIGLATCKEIVEEFGGKITIKSKLGTGSTFYLVLKKAIR